MQLIRRNIVIIFCLLICLAVDNNLYWNQNNYKFIIKTDGKGYYAYLPATFIYHDLNFGFFEQTEQKTYYDKNLFTDYRVFLADGKIINKYYCGTALVQMPFFLVAHLASKSAKAVADGYSHFYSFSISIAALFYLFIGLWFINKLLELFQISNFNRAISLIAILFGTNLFYYSVSEPAMSHVYSFSFISAFLYYVKRFFQAPQKKHIVILFIVLGIVTLIRPVNFLIILIIPFLAGDIASLKVGLKNLKNNYPAIIIGFLFFFGIIFIQLLIYKISTGKFFLYSYGEEAMNLLNPHFWDMLFSYKKGLFLYTPILFCSLTGFYFLYRRNKFEFFTLLFFLTILNYILSSWWNWWYGGSFSQRVYVEYLPLFALLLAITLQNISNKKIKVFYISILFALVLICQIQTYQYRYLIIHWDEMTKEKYWNSFLRIES